MRPNQSPGARAAGAIPGLSLRIANNSPVTVVPAINRGGTTSVSPIEIKNSRGRFETTDSDASTFALSRSDRTAPPLTETRVVVAASRLTV